MATKVAIGIMRSNAMARCLDAIPKIAGKLGIPPVDIPTQGRDPDLLHAKQLEAQAEFYEQVLTALTQSVAKDVKEVEKSAPKKSMVRD